VAKKRTYRTVAVHRIDAGELVAGLGQTRRCIVAIDIAKEAMVVGFADGQGRCSVLARFSHPKETRLFLTLLVTLRELGLAIEVVMEPTGVYGDALRYHLVGRGFPVFRVDAKRVHDAAELLDGVPSLHDPKACTILAHLHAQGLSRPWRERTDLERELRCVIDERDVFAKPFERGCGQIEAVVARHWPELSEHIDPARSWHLHLLAELPSPADVAAQPERAAEVMRRVSHGKLSAERRRDVIEQAHGSLGVPMSDPDRVLVQALAGYLLDLRKRMREIERRIRQVLDGHRELHPMVDAFGAVTTAAIVADLGNPATYESSAAFEKALGLNLKVRSSGKNTGERTLRITKRGPARARRYLFLAALRFIQSHDLVRRWYQARTSFRGGYKLKAVVALMRKLARALVHIARGAPFEPTKLFDARRLQPIVGPAPTSASPASSLAS
jgi:transposase